MTMIVRIVISLLALSVVPVKAMEKIPISVSIAPQAFFAEKVGGDRVSVHVVLPPGRSPATYAPSPAQVSKLTRSRLLFRIGVPFENSFLSGIEQTAGDLYVVDTRKGINLRRFDEDAHPHTHTDSLENGQTFQPGDGHDPHIWLDPMLVKLQAATMRDAFLAIDPEGEPHYRENYRLFERELEDLDARLRKVLAPVKGSGLLVFHPSFGYFTDAYGLRQIAVEKSGKSPKGKELSRMIKMAREENVRIVFVQPQFDQHAADKIAAAIDGIVVPLDPLSRDYFTNMDALARTIAKSLQQ